MNAPLPKKWVPNFSRLLPREPVNYFGVMIAFWLTALYLVLITVRSCIHLFSCDGGAQTIATIDSNVTGGNNIIAIFGQWGLLVEPFFRAPSGHLKPIETIGTAPGAALTWFAVPVLAILLYLALCPCSRVSLCRITNANT
ncbi:MAG: hypothetical protein WCP26_13380 [Actinomycetes bacterium]